MNLTITTTTTSIDPAASQVAAALLPSTEPAGTAAPADGGAALLLDLGLDLAGAALPGMPFGQWLDQSALAADVALDTVAETVPGAELAPVALPERQAGEERAQLEVPLMGAMSMPVVPLAQAAQATLAAVAAALPGVAGAGIDRRGQAEPVAAAAAPDAAGSAAPGMLPLAGMAAQPTPLPAEASPVQAAAPALPRLDAAVQDAAAAKPQVQAPVQAASSGAFAGALADAVREQPAGAAVERTTVTGAPVAAPAAQGAQGTSTAADTVTLSGPPTAWRQNLREALGDRLALQVGRNAEQAVIRLDPPNLGQVEIAIRHSAGTLEVTISATHREVVRQLQAVSENLRSDLAQRQFTDVAVNVGPARQSAQATPFFGSDSQGRGRQQDGQQDEATPGLALAEAHQAGAGFSLKPRN